jgi:hypothetical protein
MKVFNQMFRKPLNSHDLFDRNKFLRINSRNVIMKRGNNSPLTY